MLSIHKPRLLKPIIACVHGPKPHTNTHIDVTSRRIQPLTKKYTSVNSCAFTEVRNTEYRFMCVQYKKKKKMLMCFYTKHTHTHTSPQSSRHFDSKCVQTTMQLKMVTLHNECFCFPIQWQVVSWSSIYIGDFIFNFVWLYNRLLYGRCTERFFSSFETVLRTSFMSSIFI